MTRRADRSGTVYQRRSGSWNAAIALPSGRRHYFYGKTRARAELLLARALDAMDGPAGRARTDAEILEAVAALDPPEAKPQEIVVTAPAGVRVLHLNLTVVVSPSTVPK